jgi:plasmid stabilization system protein ParE
MSFNVRTSWIADAEVRRTFDYIRKRSPEGAASWLRAFEAALERLRERADSFGEAAESPILSSPAREMLFSTRRGLTYRIVFRIRDEEVQVLRLRGPGQAPIDPSDLP